MMRIYDVATAVSTILRRPAWDELAIPDPLLERLEATFGERVTPDEAVRRILADVRARGDEAIRDWSAKVDGQVFGSFQRDTIFTGWVIG